MKKIYVASKKSKEETLRKKYPNAEILDVTSTSQYRSAQILSPFYPHGNIPVPGMPGRKATCVEAVWQGLKVFEHQDVDLAILENKTMKNIKRTVRKFGQPLGHRYGKEEKLLDYRDARWKIYLPTYLYMLENTPKVQEILSRTRQKLEECDFVFLDYNTNCNVADYSKPLSHAGLLKLYLEGNYPTLEKRDAYEAANKPFIVYETITDVVTAIQSHAKFDFQKHGPYIEIIRKMERVDMRQIEALGENARNNWKTIIKDIQKPDYRPQQTLFSQLGKEV